MKDWLETNAEPAEWTSCAVAIAFTAGKPEAETFSADQLADGRDRDRVALWSMRMRLDRHTLVSDRRMASERREARAWPRSRRRCAASRRCGTRGGAEDVFQAVTRRSRGCSSRLRRTCPTSPTDVHRRRTCTPVAGTRAPPVGSRWPLSGRTSQARVRDRPCGPNGQLCRCNGSARRGHPRGGRALAVGTPIIVEGKLWASSASPTRATAASCGHRGAPRLVHGAGGDGDRECREPRRARPAAEEQAALRGSRRWWRVGTLRRSVRAVGERVGRLLSADLRTSAATSPTVAHLRRQRREPVSRRQPVAPRGTDEPRHARVGDGPGGPLDD